MLAVLTTKRVVFIGTAFFDSNSIGKLGIDCAVGVARFQVDGALPCQYTRFIVMLVIFLLGRRRQCLGAE